MTPFEKAEQTKSELERSGLTVDIIYNSYSAAEVHIVYRGRTLIHTGMLPLTQVLATLYRFRIQPTKNRVRPVITVWLLKYNDSGVLVRRPYQFRSPPVNSSGEWVWVVSDSHLSRVIPKFHSWVAKKHKVSLRLPWTVKNNRPPSEGSSSTLFTYRMSEGNLTSYSDYPYTNYSRSWTGTRTPGFRKIKKSALPVNNHSVSMFRLGNYGEYHRERRLNPSTGAVMWDFEEVRPFGIPASVPVAPSFDGTLYDKAVKRLIANAQVGLDSNLAQDLVQIQMTIDMIANSSRRISGSLLALKRGNFSAAIKSLWQNRNPRFRKGQKPSFTGDLANNWLELQYGWKPLLSDVRGSMEALARFNLADTAVKQARSSASKKSETTTILRTNDIAPTDIGSVKTSERVSCRLVLRYRIASRLTAFLAQTGFTNPINLAWEILPFSFVVDWFLPIGPYLETLSSWDGLEFMDGSRTDFAWKRVLGREYFNGSLKMHDPAAYVDQYFGLYFRDAIELRRIRLTTFPSASLPSLKNGLSTEHALNGVALLRQVFGK